MPTLDEVRAAFEEWLKTYHATPQTGDGMFGLSPTLAMERFRGVVRKCSPEALDLICARMAGPVKVGRDGVKYRGILYGRFCEQLYSLQGKDVWLRIDPAEAGFVTVCDQAGTPICRAENSRLRCATREDVRKAAEHKGHLRKITRKALEGRQFLLDSTPGQVMSLKREAAEAAQAELRKAMPEPEPPAVTIVRPDLHAAAEQIKRENPFLTLARKADPADGREFEPADSTGELLAQAYGGWSMQESEQQEEIEAANWADYLKRTGMDLGAGPDTAGGRHEAVAG